MISVQREGNYFKLAELNTKSEVRLYSLFSQSDSVLVYQLALGISLRFFLCKMHVMDQHPSRPCPDSHLRGPAPAIQHTSTHMLWIQAPATGLLMCLKHSELPALVLLGIFLVLPRPSCTPFPHIPHPPILHSPAQKPPKSWSLSTLVDSSLSFRTWAIFSAYSFHLHFDSWVLPPFPPEHWVVSSWQSENSMHRALCCAGWKHRLGLQCWEGILFCSS